MHSLLLLQHVCGCHMHLTLKLVQLLSQAMRRDSMVLGDGFVEPRDGGVGVRFESSDSSLQAGYRSARTLTRFKDCVGGECCCCGGRVVAGEETHDAFDAVGGEGGFKRLEVTAGGANLRRKDDNPLRCGRLGLV